MRALLLVALGVVSAGELLARPPALIIVRPPTLRETVSDSVVTAGTSVIGLTVGNPGATLRGADLIVTGLRENDRRICVSIERSSGLYLAQFDIARPADAESVRIRLAGSAFSRMPKRIGEFAVRAQAASGSCRGKLPLLPVAWGLPANAGELHLQINSLQANSVTLVSSTPDNRQAVTCRNLRDTMNAPAMSVRNFDTICAIPAPACGAIASYKLYRRFGGDVPPPEDVRVRGRC